MAGAQREVDVLAEINVTPLVDVMLVLLVVMMVTASTIVTKSLAVELPHGVSGAANEHTLLVTLTREGVCLLDDRALDTASLRREVRARRQLSPELSALVAADGGLRHARVVEVLDLLREERVTRVAVGVDPVGP